MKLNNKQFTIACASVWSAAIKTPSHTTDHLIPWMTKRKEKEPPKPQGPKRCKNCGKVGVLGDGLCYQCSRASLFAQPVLVQCKECQRVTITSPHSTKAHIKPYSILFLSYFIWFYVILLDFMWFYLILCDFIWFYMIWCDFIDMWFYLIYMILYCFI